MPAQRLAPLLLTCAMPRCVVSPANAHPGGKWDRIAVVARIADLRATNPKIRRPVSPGDFSRGCHARRPPLELRSLPIDRDVLRSARSRARHLSRPAHDAGQAADAAPL